MVPLFIALLAPFGVFSIHLPLDMRLLSLPLRHRAVLYGRGNIFML